MAITTLHLFLHLLSIALTFYKPHATQTQTRTANSLVLGLSFHPGATEFPVQKTASRYFLKKASYRTLDMVEPIKELSNGDGYIMNIPLGTPSQRINNVIFDTGSDLFWVPCGKRSFSCMNCENYRFDTSSIFHPKLSTSLTRVSCSNHLCFEIHSSNDKYDPCIMAGCTLASVMNESCNLRPCPTFSYTYAYGVVAGILSRDILGAHSDNPNNNDNTSANITFGCIGSTYEEPYGIAGFGKGPLSLPSQLGVSSFSHCFLLYEYASYPNISCPLVLGDIALSSKEDLQYTPMLNNFKYPNLYYIGLESVTVGNLSAIQVPSTLIQFDSAGNGGMIIDSGTSYTQFDKTFYLQILSNLKSLIKHPRAEDVEKRTTFDLCYMVPSDAAQDVDEFPSITFHFLNNVDLTLPSGTYFSQMGRAVNLTMPKCLLINALEDEGYGPTAVLGSFQQQNVEVVYDLKRERIGFKPTNCYAKSQGFQKQMNF